jgi:hypothetical protein
MRWESLELIYINDRSSDRTGEILDEIHRNDPNLKQFTLPENFGHEAQQRGLDYPSSKHSHHRCRSARSTDDTKHE